MTGTRDSPYLGTRPFQQADYRRFFGRAADAEALAELWQVSRLIFASGPVASGKTSLLGAGVFPLVRDTRADVLPVGRISYGSTFPFAALPEHNPYTLALLQSWSPGETATQLVGVTVHNFIQGLAERHDGIILAAIDQVEDLLAGTGPRWVHRRQFLAELSEAMRQEPRLHLLLLVRDEALNPVSDVLGDGARYHVAGLARQGAIEAVREPVQGTGRSFAEGAAEKLVSELQTSRIMGADGLEHYVTGDRVEPSLLQVVCAWLWERLPPDVSLITPHDVRLFGDADTALSAHCGRVIAAVADDHDLPVTRLRTWLRGTFVTEMGTRGGAYEGAISTAGMPNAVARAMEDRHLLRAELRSGTRWYELLTDRLLEPLRGAPAQQPPPTGPADYLRAAERAFTLGELDTADRYAEVTLRTSAETDLRIRADVESLLGNLASERDKPGEAEMHYRVAAGLFEMLRDTSAVARQLAAIGQTLLVQERAEDAVDELRAAVDRMPADPIMQTDLGVALWKLGDGQAAVAVLTKVLGVDGGNPVALRARGEILADLGEAPAAMLDLDRMPLKERSATQAARGLALAKLGDRSGAYREIEDALADAPRNGLVLLYAARARALGGDELAAEELARRAADATDPVLPPHHREVALRIAGHEHEKSATLTPGVTHRLPPERGYPQVSALTSGSPTITP